MQETQTPEFKRTLVIDRTKWYRGLTDQYLTPSLLDVNGTMCCLGFECIACGIPSDHLYRKGMPDELESFLDRNRVAHLLSDSKYSSSPFAKRAADINDRRIGETIGQDATHYFDDAEKVTLETESQRETLIAAEFATQGIKVEFIN